MKYIIVAVLLAMSIMSCGEDFECSNYEVLEGEMSLNGDILYPIDGTFVNEIETFGIKVFTWSVKGVDESCAFNNTIVFSVSVDLSDPITGAFDFETQNNNMAGQAWYDYDENNEGGRNVNIESGTLVVEDESDGVLTLDFDGFDEVGDFVDLEVRFKFK